MTANLAVRQARERLGRVGVGLAFPPVSARTWRQDVRLMEKLGYRSVWSNELIGGKDALLALALALGATSEIVAGAGVANLWARHPAAMQAGGAMLAEAYPDRFVLGVGVSYRVLVEASGQTWGKPLATQRTYLERMRASAGTTVQPASPLPIVLGAVGPKMLDLARDEADGAVLASLSVTHTAQARERLGPDKLMAVGVSVIPEADPARAREAARRSPFFHIPDSPFVRALRQLGYPESDFAGGASDRLVDDTFAHGTPDAIAARVQEHLDAGADHVVLYPALGEDAAVQIRQLEELAPAVVG